MHKPILLTIQNEEQVSSMTLCLCGKQFANYFGNAARCLTVLMNVVVGRVWVRSRR